MTSLALMHVMHVYAERTFAVTGVTLSPALGICATTASAALAAAPSPTTPLGEMSPACPAVRPDFAATLRMAAEDGGRVRASPTDSAGVLTAVIKLSDCSGCSPVPSRARMNVDADGDSVVPPGVLMAGVPAAEGVSVRAVRGVSAGGGVTNAGRDG